MSQSEYQLWSSIPKQGRLLQWVIGQATILTTQQMLKTGTIILFQLRLNQLSTVKMFTWAAAIEEGVYNGNEAYKSGQYQPNGSSLS